MKSIPFLATANEVRCIPDDTPMQVMRPIKPQPVSEGMRSYGESWSWNLGNPGWFSGVTADQIANPNYGIIKSLPSPLGVPGDRWWWRETWGVGSRPDPWGGYDGIEYRADEAFLCDEHDDLDCCKVETPEGVCLGDYRRGWHSSASMPKWASRITTELLKVSVVRAEKDQGKIKAGDWCWLFEVRREKEGL